MRYSRTSAFRRLFRKLPGARQEAAERALLRLDEALRLGRPAPGLGLKELRHSLWEIRAGLLDRIVFFRSSDLIEFVVIGTHDEIKRFLRRLCPSEALLQSLLPKPRAAP